MEAQRDWPHGPRPERRCRAHKKNGDQCKNAAIKGSTVCRFHGGAAKHVKAAARARLENAADLMAQQLLGIALTADNEAVKLAAIRDALDRSGITKPTEIVVSPGERKPYEEVFDSISCGPREESRAARGFAGNAENAENANLPTQPDVDLPTAPQAPAPPAESFPTRVRAVEDSESVSCVVDTEAFSSLRPVRKPRPDAVASERDGEGVERPTHHVTGDEALAAAAEMRARQRAIERPHKRYRRPRTPRSGRRL